jgi:hypothetical protein
VYHIRDEDVNLTENLMDSCQIENPGYSHTKFFSDHEMVARSRLLDKEELDTTRRAKKETRRDEITCDY